MLVFGSVSTVSILEFHGVVTPLPLDVKSASPSTHLSNLGEERPSCATFVLLQGVSSTPGKKSASASTTTKKRQNDIISLVRFEVMQL